MSQPSLLPDPDGLFAGSGEMARLMREKDWSATGLGPPSGWPQSLRTTVRILLTSRFSMWLGWGNDVVYLYNDAYRPTFGAKHPAALGMPFREVWPEIWSTLRPRIEDVMRGGEATWDEGLLLFLERSGFPEETYHTFSYSPVPGDDGGVGGLLCVVSEVTAQVIGERRLALLRDKASALSGAKSEAQVFEAVDRCLAGGTRDIPFSLAYLFDESGAQEPPAPRLVSRSGFPAGESTGELDAAGVWPLAEVRSGGGAPVVVQLEPGRFPRGPWSEAPRQAVVFPIAQQGQAKPLGARVFGLNPHLALDEKYLDFLRLLVGQVTAALANARAYEAERARAQALAELDRAKTQFFSNVSHEFRTPLTLMLGPIGELLADAPAGTAAHAQLALVHRNGLRLLKLVNSMLEFSRIEAGRVQARYEPTDLAELTQDLASVFRSATDKAGLVLRVDCAPLSEPVFVDRDMWEKIVFNLVSNAFKFTLQGEISVSLRELGGQLQLTVRDTGRGVPAHELPHLFERFHRVEGQSGRTHEGTGIGLALVQELVKLHGGSVSVESELDRGTAFTVTVPLGQAHLPQDRIRSSLQLPVPRAPNAFVEEALRWLPEEDGAPAAAADGAAPERVEVLLADDNADMREYIRRLLGPRWNVKAVANGSEALQAALRERPDVVITDVMMPVLDGFGLLRELRSRESTRAIPVLMLSARAGEESRLEALEAGAADYLVKPFAARELLSRVDSVVLQSRLRALEEAQSRRLNEIFSHAPMAVALLRGPQHVFELANPAYSALVGGRPLLGRPYREALPELAGQGIYELLDQAFASGEAHRVHSLRALVEKNGAVEEGIYDVVYQPIVEEGRVAGVAIVGFEVTELSQARRQAEVANRAKDEFLAMLGHELRNPLAPILTALQLMRLREGVGGERERAVIERQARHLVRMVDDLLDVSRVTQGKLELRRVRLELADVVAQAIETSSPLIEQQRHELRVEVPKGLAVDADATRLAQVIANLLTNAAKYTPPGGSIQVLASAQRGRVILKVRDSGIGIEPGMISQIFEPFTQERQALDRSQGGLGLGLAIVRSLVSLHGGTVSVRSEGRDRGSEFVVSLPRAAGDGQLAATSIPTLPRLTAVSAVRVLVVDDNEDAAEMLAELLGADDVLVRVAHDGPEALQLAAEFRPDVAILDIGLPVMDGYELAARFAEHAALKRTRLIAVTGYGQREDRERSAAAGFAAHLVKPVDAEKLRDAIRSVAAGSGRGARGPRTA